MREKIIINSKNDKIRKICIKVYDFLTNFFPSLLNKLYIIDFVSPLQIKSLKKKIWNMNTTTDTITLIFDDSVHIYLCLGVIRKNSATYGLTFEDELSLVLIHSFLHSLGKSEEEVSSIQEELFRELKNEQKI